MFNKKSSNKELTTVVITVDTDNLQKGIVTLFQSVRIMFCVSHLNTLLLAIHTYMGDCAVIHFDKETADDSMEVKYSLSFAQIGAKLYKRIEEILRDQKKLGITSSHVKAASKTRLQFAIKEIHFIYEVFSDHPKKSMRNLAQSCARLIINGTISIDKLGYNELKQKLGESKNETEDLQHKITSLTEQLLQQTVLLNTVKNAFNTDETANSVEFTDEDEDEPFSTYEGDCH